MKPTTNCTTTIYKSLVAFIFMLFHNDDQSFLYMHFSMKKRKVILNDRHQKCVIPQNIQNFIY